MFLKMVVNFEKIILGSVEALELTRVGGMGSSGAVVHRHVSEKGVTPLLDLLSLP
jgi:hypothetical protein